MTLKRKIYLIYILPALVIHELSHLITMFLLGKRFWITHCEIDKRTNHYHVSFSHSMLSTFQEFLVSYAPLFAMLIFGFLGINNEWCLLIFLYQLTANEVALPSYDDVDTFKDTYIENEELKEWRKQQIQK